MDRKNKILRDIDREGRGIEIGASVNPVAPKRDGFNIEIIDHLDRDGLLEKYASDLKDPNIIEEVDYVWRGEDYSTLVGGRHLYDYVIASHVIEHVPDIIKFINDCSALLKDDGVLSLVIPDKRACFDYFRPITSLSEFIDRHERKIRQPGSGPIAEFLLNFATNDGQIAWSLDQSGDIVTTHSTSEAVNLWREMTKSDDYNDVHMSCFVPHSFRLLIKDLNALGLIDLKEVSFFPTVGCEFYVSLGRHGSGTELSRAQILSEINSELALSAADSQSFSGRDEKLEDRRPPIYRWLDSVGRYFDFDNFYYLENNPDVKEAVARGEFRSGRHHYKCFGKAEGRSPSVNPRF